MNKGPLGYLGGDIMTHGSNLARQEEYDKFKAAGIPGEVYSPVQNKSINDKSSMTEEENNHLAEKICEADIERLWNSDYTVLCPEQSAIGTMCEMGVLYGWQYMAKKLLDIRDEIIKNTENLENELSDNNYAGDAYQKAYNSVNEKIDLETTFNIERILTDELKLEGVYEKLEIQSMYRYIHLNKNYSELIEAMLS